MECMNLLYHNFVNNVIDQVVYLLCVIVENQEVLYSCIHSSYFTLLDYTTKKSVYKIIKSLELLARVLHYKFIY